MGLKYRASTGKLLRTPTPKLVNSCPSAACCVGGVESNVVFLRFDLLTPGCASHEDTCTVLIRTGVQRWAGSHPLGGLVLTIACAGGNTTLTLTWTLTAGGTAVFTKVIAASSIACTGCIEHELRAINNTTCTAVSPTSSAFINFSRGLHCCNTCSSLGMQVTFNGFTSQDGEGLCTNNDCATHFGGDTYLCNFLASKTTCTVAACDGSATPHWCRWSTPILLPCTNNNFGFCTVDVFIRTNSDCTLHVVAAVSADKDAVRTCGAAGFTPTWQGWQRFNVASDCSSLDITMFSPSNACVDNNWNCDNGVAGGPGATVRVRAV